MGLLVTPLGQRVVMLVTPLFVPQVCNVIPHYHSVRSCEKKVKNPQGGGPENVLTSPKKNSKYYYFP
jgi:hypothetical protein